MQNVMLDLETMGTTPGAAIASIGAVEFDPSTGQLGREFYSAVSLRSCQAARMRFDADTISWWLKQGDAARAALDGGEDLHVVIPHFAGFWKAVGGKFIWSHGANFDEPLLAAAFRAVGHTPPLEVLGLALHADHLRPGPGEAGPRRRHAPQRPRRRQGAGRGGL